MRFNKKAAMELSINAIVILVIAMVFIGLVLGFIRTLFRSGTDKFTSVIDMTEIENKPDAANIVTFNMNELPIQQKKPAPLKVGFFNKEQADVNVALSKTGTRGYFDCAGVDNDVRFKISTPTILAAAAEGVAMQATVMPLCVLKSGYTKAAEITTYPLETDCALTADTKPVAIPSGKYTCTISTYTQSVGTLTPLVWDVKQQKQIFVTVA